MALGVPRVHEAPKNVRKRLPLVLSSLKVSLISSKKSFTVYQIGRRRHKKNQN